MLIKVCGMREADNIREVDALGVDIIGLIFWPKSARYVAQRPAYLPQKAQRAGVFVNASEEEIIKKTKEYQLDFIQLHGDETLSYVTSLHKRLAVEMEQENIPRIVRAISVASRGHVLKAMMWDGYVDGILFETPSNGYGGSGVQFDWSLLTSYRSQTPFFLTGGIGPQSIDNLLAFEHPEWLGVDLNSKFESAPGVKDLTLLRPFVEKLRTLQLRGLK